MVRDNKKYKYGDVHVVLVDQNLAIRHLIRGALSALGFAHITELRTVDEMVSVLNTTPVDLLCLDLDLELEQACKVIREIRNSRTGANPFVVVMAMTWHPMRESVVRTLNAGTDDLVTKPVSAQKLEDRVVRMVRARKDFVVTQGYLGPDRRHDDRRGQDDLPTIKVPNTLRHKVAGDAAAALTKESIEQTMGAIKTHRIYRIAMQIGVLAQKLEARSAQNTSSPLPRQSLADIAELVRLANQMITQEGMPHLHRLSTSMSHVMNTVTGQVYQSPRHFEVLRLHAHGIVALIREDEQATDIVAAALNKAVEFIETHELVEDRAAS